MVLRRITTSLRQVSGNVRDQNWTAIGIEFVLVILGVFLGIMAANWNEAVRASTGDGIYSQDRAGAQAMLSAFVRAEAIKIVMAVVLFSAAAIFLSHVYLPLVITFVATLTVNWFALLFTRHDPAGWGR